jgi:transposase
VIVPASGVKVLIATRPVDFRKGMDGLAAVVRESLGSDPYGGVIYVFRARRADRVKLLYWDGTGVVLVAKRLEAGSFRWPSIADGGNAADAGAAVGPARRPGLGARARGSRAGTDGGAVAATW